MLILTRKVGEAVRIGDGTELYVVSVSRGKVKLGFNAPRNVRIQRSEVAGPVSPAPIAEPAFAAAECITNGPPLRALRTALVVGSP